MFNVRHRLLPIMEVLSEAGKDVMGWRMEGALSWELDELSKGGGGVPKRFVSLEGFVRCPAVMGPLTKGNHSERIFGCFGFVATVSLILVACVHVDWVSEFPASVSGKMSRDGDRHWGLPFDSDVGELAMGNHGTS